jgi:hypothetical protein
MTLSIAPETPLHESVYQRLLNSLPVSDAYFRLPVTIPFSAKPTAFLLKTSALNGLVHRIYVNGDQVTGVIPERETTRVLLQIPRGVGEIVVLTDNESFSLSFAATHIATLLSGVAKELYVNARVKIDENEAALASPFGSRYVEHLLAFQDLLPSNRAPRTAAVKMAIRNMISGFATEAGVRDFITALTYSTPHVVPLQNSGTDFDPRVYPILRRQQDFAGFEFHVWFPNNCVFTWVAFTRLADNVRGPYALETVSENQVTLLFNGEEQRHVFDSDAEACIDSLSQLLTCFDNIRAYLETYVLADFGFCAAAYPFDVVVEEPLGIGLLDTGLFDDVGGTFDDDVDELDPLWNGYLGESLVDRFDGDHCLDSFGAASRQQDISCCWPGAAVEPLWHCSWETEIRAL